MKLLAYSKTTEIDISEQISNPLNRKKSINMLLCEDSLKKLLESTTLPVGLPLKLFLCSGEGELAQTYKFYYDLAVNQRARPILFQNSLHNSTLGSCSIAFPNIEMGATISSSLHSIESALDIALNEIEPALILIVGVDAYPSELKEIKEASHSGKINLESACSSAIFINDKSHACSKASPFGAIKDIHFDFSVKEGFENLGPYFPANGLDSLFEKLSLLKKEEKIDIFKPNGTSISYDITYD